MTDIDLIIDAILEIGNNKEAMNILEPHVMQPLKLERWMVARTLAVLAEIEKELENGNT